MTISATYSPDDNKLRLYASSKLDDETYARVKAAGYGWAPQQKLFVAPMWTPEREDIALELAGEIDDEDTSLVDRASTRAERFEGYSERRGAEAHSARAAAETIMDGIPLGQPILVGHHSERRARRDAEKIDNGLRKSLRLWETSKYWTRRAAGAVAAAKYKERPEVRARRIKTLEAERRRWVKRDRQWGSFLRIWSKLHEPGSLTKNGQEVSFKERALHVASADYAGGLWSDLDADRITPEIAQQQRVAGLRLLMARAQRWIAHLDNRLAYEGEMLKASGWTPPPKPKTKADLPLLNISGPVAYRNPYRATEIVKQEKAHPMTKAALAKIPSDYKGTRVSEDGTHRLRYAMIGRGQGNFGAEYAIVFLTDSKEHDRPGDDARRAAAEEEEQAAVAREVEADARAQRQLAAAPARAAAAAADAPFDAVRASLRGGVQAVSAPQLFPTPEGIAAEMVEALGVRNGDRVLEPSAGTGALLKALFAGTSSKVLHAVVAIEINAGLARTLKAQWNADVICGDFLMMQAEHVGDQMFDRILMNPPFAHGIDIKHIEHALSLLAPGGRLVALCAAGPRQKAALAHLGADWTDLPPGSFAAQGTGVNVAMVVIDRPGLSQAVAS